MVSKRSIFEEVSDFDTERANPKIKTGIIEKAELISDRMQIRAWLICLSVLLVFMILVGGLTRLTDSGLSITEWKPILGAFPPVTEQAWDLEFEKYKLIPEYILQNSGMLLSEFKIIYWWEWGHRQLGRIIGLVWFLGFSWFLVSKKIPVGWTGRLLTLGALGGFQGAVGWWMVSSGLSNNMLDVASYRLATHLGIAFIILGFILWYTLILGLSEADLLVRLRTRDQSIYSKSTGLMHLIFLQILLGALVAGIDAGRNYVDWPLMAGGFLPPDLFVLEPVWRNFFEDDGLVQFIHRMSGYILFFFGIYVWFRSRKSGNSQIRNAISLVMLIIFLQMTIGVITVMYSAPWHIAIFHQFGAIVLWYAIIRARFLAAFPPKQSLS
ncbi:MAG: COX15/CtaA family protein [Paracoccaceae bacterium]|nr:COX15/CtaA family protein [Paracoccaceae bacterium]